MKKILVILSSTVLLLFGLGSPASADAAATAAVDAYVAAPITTLAEVTTANDLRVTAQDLVTELADAAAQDAEQLAIDARTAVVAPAAVVLYEALPITTLVEVTAAETFGLVTQALVTAMADADDKTAEQTKVETKDDAVEAAKTTLTAAALAAATAAVDAYEIADITTLAEVTTANDLRVTAQDLVTELADAAAQDAEQLAIDARTAVVAPAAVVLYEALPITTLVEVTAAETFGLVTQDLVTAIFDSVLIDFEQAKVDAQDSLVAAARLALTPAASTPSTPVDDGAWKQNLQTIPVSVPGFFSGEKWTITKDADGDSTVKINLAKSQAGKSAKIYKRTIKGKLFLLGEQTLGKNGRATVETDKPLRTGQKVRVQVDGTFRSTVTMP